MRTDGAAVSWSAEGCGDGRARAAAQDGALGLLSAPLCCRMGPWGCSLPPFAVGAHAGPEGCSAAERFCIEAVSFSTCFTTCSSSAHCWALGVSCGKQVPLHIFLQPFQPRMSSSVSSAPSYASPRARSSGWQLWPRQLCSQCRCSAHSGAVTPSQAAALAQGPSDGGRLGQVRGLPAAVSFGGGRTWWWFLPTASPPELVVLQCFLGLSSSSPTLDLFWKLFVCLNQVLWYAILHNAGSPPFCVVPQLGNAQGRAAKPQLHQAFEIGGAAAADQDC